jgi:hypothetical protein
MFIPLFVKVTRYFILLPIFHCNGSITLTCYHSWASVTQNLTS